MEFISGSLNFPSVNKIDCFQRISDTALSGLTYFHQYR